MNVTLLRKIQKNILKYPERFDMDSFQNKLKGKTGACGTTCCIGGWAMYENGCRPKMYREENWDGGFYKELGIADPKGNRISDEQNYATKSLRLKYDEADRLFHHSYWPTQFRTVHESAKSPLIRAANAAARIEHFIATDGLE